MTQAPPRDAPHNGADMRVVWWSRASGWPVAALWLAATLWLALGIAACDSTATPTPPATSTIEPVPTPTISCTAEVTPLPSMLSSDPCPEAVLAVQLAVAPVRLPIERLVVAPGPFYCDILWPGVDTPATCRGMYVQPGQFMHGWASFRGSDEVAAVMLGLDLPTIVDTPASTRPPWHATLVTVEVPPAGWVMP